MTGVKQLASFSLLLISLSTLGKDYYVMILGLLGIPYGDDIAVGNFTTSR